jgi:hypothetical protein
MGRAGLSILRRPATYLATLAVAAIPVGGQSATLVGSVRTDSGRHHGIENAQILIPQLHVAIRTDSAGAFRIDHLAGGSYVVIARAMGYTEHRDTVAVDSSDATLHVFSLSRHAVALDSVHTSSDRSEYFSPSLKAFEKRRTSGSGGFFISEQQMRKYDNQRLTDALMPNIPGIRLVQNGSGSSVAPLRVSRGGVFTMSKGQACFSTVYLDGVRLYDAIVATRSRGMMPPNLEDFSVRDLAGVEYYPGDATSPPQFHQSNCGLLLLWTREK